MLMHSHGLDTDFCALYGLKYYMVAIIIVVIIPILHMKKSQSQTGEEACLTFHIQ